MSDMSLMMMCLAFVMVYFPEILCYARVQYEVRICVAYRRLISYGPMSLNCILYGEHQCIWIRELVNVVLLEHYFDVGMFYSAMHI